MPLQQRPHRTTVQRAIALRPRRSDGRSLGSIQHAELDAREIRRAPHHPTQRVHLAYDRALRDPADGGIAGHLADRFEILGEKQRARARPRGEHGGFRASVSAADDDDIVPLGHVDSTTSWGIGKFPLACNGHASYLSAFAPTTLPMPMPYRIKIDRTLCTGYAECVGIAPEVFKLGDDNISVVVDSEAADEETVLDAARACPVDAITVLDEFDDQLWPA
jgi:ferredoxin